MERSIDENTQDGVVRDTYTPNQERSLTDAVLDAIENCKGDGLMRTDFALYEDINPEALNNLLRHDAQPRTRVAFMTDDIQIDLWRDDGVEIRVTDQRGET